MSINHKTFNVTQLESSLWAFSLNFIGDNNTSFYKHSHLLFHEESSQQKGCCMWKS